MVFRPDELSELMKDAEAFEIRREEVIEVVDQILLQKARRQRDYPLIIELCDIAQKMSLNVNEVPVNVQELMFTGVIQSVYNEQNGWRVAMRKTPYSVYLSFTPYTQVDATINE